MQWLGREYYSSHEVLYDHGDEPVIFGIRLEAIASRLECLLLVVSCWNQIRRICLSLLQAINKAREPHEVDWKTSTKLLGHEIANLISFTFTVGNL